MIPVKGSAPSPKTPKVTIGLITLNAIVFLFEMSLGSGALQELVHRWGFTPARYWQVLGSEPEAVGVWLAPIFSSMFMHGGWGHIIGNMLFLWVFGDGVENRIGSWRFLILYLLVGVAATNVHALVNPGSLVPTIGASGAVAGVLGAYLLLYPTSTVVLLVPIFFYPLFFRLYAFLFIGIWFLEQLFFGAFYSMAPLNEQVGGVAWWAHIGGLIAGAILILVMARDREPPEPRERPKLFPGARPY